MASMQDLADRISINAQYGQQQIDALNLVMQGLEDMGGDARIFLLMCLVSYSEIDTLSERDITLSINEAGIMNVRLNCPGLVTIEPGEIGKIRTGG